MAVYFNGKNVKRLLLLTGHLWRETENYAVAMEILLIPGYFLHNGELLAKMEKRSRSETGISDVF